MRWKTDPSPVPRPASDTARRGVTLVETLLVVGILMILAGLLMPALARVQEQQRHVQDMAGARNYMLGITVVAEDHGGRTQVPEGGNGTVIEAMHSGDSALLQHGFVQSRAQLDPWGMERLGAVRFATAGALTNPPGYFTAALTEFFGNGDAEGVQLALVHAPSSLVGVYQWVAGDSWDADDQWCCPRPPGMWQRGAIAFVDGSVQRRAVLEFAWPEQGVLNSNMVGVPALSTLNGVRGRDRLGDANRSGSYADFE